MSQTSPLDTMTHPPISTGLARVAHRWVLALLVLRGLLSGPRGAQPRRPGPVVGRGGVLVSNCTKPIGVLYGCTQSYKTQVVVQLAARVSCAAACVWGCVAPAPQPCRAPLSARGWAAGLAAPVGGSGAAIPPGAPAPRAALAQRRPPLRPPGALAGWRALAPCAGGPPGVFRRLRAPGAGSGTALTRAALARDNSGN